MTSGPSFEQRLRRHLDHEAQSLDAASLSRLRQARAAAIGRVDSGPRRRWFGTPLWVLPAAGFAALLGLAVGLSLWQQTPAPGLELQALAGDEQILVEIVEAELDMEMLEEIEFYDWLTLAQGDST